MADYFDRLAARAHGDGVTARPPARANGDPSFGGVHSGGVHSGGAHGLGGLALDAETAAVINAVDALDAVDAVDAVDADDEDNAPDATSARAGQGFARTARPSRAPSQEVETRPPLLQHAPQSSGRRADAQAEAAATAGERRRPLPPPGRSTPDFRPTPGSAIPVRARTVPLMPVSPGSDRMGSGPPSRAHMLDAPSTPPIAVSENASSPPADKNRIPHTASIRSRVSPAGIPRGSAVPAAGLSSPDSAPPSQTVIRVSIGRVEVRATVPAPAPPAPTRAAPTPPKLTLDSYLERTGERRKR